MQNPDKLTWDNVAEIINNELGENGTSNKYRKEFTRKFKEMIDTRSDEISTQEEIYEKVSEKLVQIRKEKTVLEDLRRDANAQIRFLDRFEYLKEIAVECAKEIQKNFSDYKFKPLTVETNSYKREALLLLGDWHFGIEVDSFWNTYNPEECKKRLQKLLEQTISVCSENKVKVINIFNLGDLISGRIHSQLRMQSRMDAVEQTMKAAALLEMFILNLRQHDFVINYYDCLDNHSRIEPNKKESLQLESFAKFIHWHLDTAFKNVSNVNIIENEYGEDIICADILGHKIIGVHGDKDDPRRVVKGLTALLAFKPDLICTAHRHHYAADETTRCPVLCNPSLMGQDQYALDGRLDSTPAQLLVILTKDNPIYGTHRLIVD